MANIVDPTNTQHRDAERAPLIEVRSVTKTFESLDGPKAVLEGIDLDVRPREILALLGKSGSGKSTLLRCLAGLIAPTSGEVRYRGELVRNPTPGTAMVFQTFALLPWETVQQNVQIGLDAQRVPPEEAAERAVRAIDLIGLDGFESAYPKELSGGMRQRVGFARAIVTNPEVLLMDEPFSALDVLTAENLRGEVLELWARTDIPIQAIVIVTHNIEEAVLLADRVVVLGTNPGRIRAEVDIALERPRVRRSAEFQATVDHLYRLMTGTADPVTGATSLSTTAERSPIRPLPHATVDGLSGLAEILERVGPSRLRDVAAQLGLRADDLLPPTEALEMLGFASVDDGRVGLTSAGRTFASADIQVSKEIFADAARRQAPIVSMIVKALDRTSDRRLRVGFFLDVLRRNFSDAEAQRQLDIALDWGRYAELYEYDANHEELSAAAVGPSR